MGLALSSIDLALLLDRFVYELLDRQFGDNLIFTGHSLLKVRIRKCWVNVCIISEPIVIIFQYCWPLIWASVLIDLYSVVLTISATVPLGAPVVCPEALYIPTWLLGCMFVRAGTPELLEIPEFAGGLHSIIEHQFLYHFRYDCFCFFDYQKLQK